MNYIGTKGRVRVIPSDPNNSRIDLESVPALGVGGTFTQVTVDATGRVVSGQYIEPVTNVTQIIQSGSSGSPVNAPVVYVADPNVEALTPADPTKPCVAYSADGTLAFFGWDIVNLKWI